MCLPRLVNITKLIVVAHWPLKSCWLIKHIFYMICVAVWIKFCHTKKWFFWIRKCLFLLYWSHIINSVVAYRRLNWFCIVCNIWFNQFSSIQVFNFWCSRKLLLRWLIALLNPRVQLLFALLLVSASGHHDKKGIF